MTTRSQFSKKPASGGNGGTVKALDLTGVKTYSIKKRKNKVQADDMAIPLPGSGAERFLSSLPNQLKAKDFREFLKLVQRARKNSLPIHWMMGAHVIKTGLSPLIIDLMKSGFVTGVSFNGAGVIHELELAFWGGTSEDVATGLADGSFGMASETAELFAEALEYAKDKNLGLGQGAGEFIRKKKAPYQKLSMLAESARRKLPATIHVGIGSDIVAQSPKFSGALVGELSHLDFRILAAVLQRADCGGVALNVGSAAVLPEVFLKALTVARNLAGVNSGSSRSSSRSSFKIGKIVTANFDMIKQYRPQMNVVERPTQATGHGFEFIGHHEIMIPLLAWALKGSAKQKK